MLIKDLYSHKIHSSGDDWPLKLIEIATVFAKFDGKPFDRSKIEEEFRRISPRASIVARDPSKYRDEISAYPSYLGLYRLQRVDGKWILRLSETAKRFLIVEEPNVSAFMILQMSMFQYPNGNGASFSNRGVRMQKNAASRTLEFINNGIHLSPFRLICKALLADSIINGINPLHPRVSVSEISVLCNDNRVNSVASPDVEVVANVLRQIREQRIPPTEGFESRFHILNHTDLIEHTKGWIHLRQAYSPADEIHLIKLLNYISNLDLEFSDFDYITSVKQLTDAVANGTWSKYFDGVVQLPSEFVQLVAGELLDGVGAVPPLVQDQDDLVADNKAIQFKYPLRERGSEPTVIRNSNYRLSVKADPEVTRIKRQKSNLQHKILLSQLDEYLRNFGAIPKDNEHIDLYAELSDQRGFLFEVKSVHSENLLSQTRKGLSQLYEYRFRYSEDIQTNSTLCLLYPYEPNEIDWLQEYLCNDRQIAVAWFENNQLRFPDFCSERLKFLTQPK